MAKKVKVVLKLNIQAGKATPAPPIGPALGQQGVPIMDFCKQYNERTKDQKDVIIPAVITVYEDRTFTFITKTPPTTDLLKKAVNKEKGSSNPNKDKIGKISKQAIEEIAKQKMGDLNTKDLQQSIKIVVGTARSMGIEVER
ncbi:MAG: 50S ribosomal protein L11 [bacterium]|nr:50S ribosomal protein L11 [bacterium]